LHSICTQAFCPPNPTAYLEAFKSEIGKRDSDGCIVCCHTAHLVYVSIQIFAVEGLAQQAIHSCSSWAIPYCSSRMTNGNISRIQKQLQDLFEEPHELKLLIQLDRQRQNLNPIPSTNRTHQHPSIHTRIQKGNAPIRIQHKRNLPHPPIRQLLLERDAKGRKPRAGAVDVVDRDRDMTEATARVSVPRSIPGEGGVRLGPVVVRQFEDALG
jgi:hypothetical protein